MIPIFKYSVEGSLAIESTFHTDIQNIVIGSFQVMDCTVHSGIIQILTESSMESTRESS